MTVLDTKAASGVEGRNFGQYVAVALVAGAIGVGAALGFRAITDIEEFGPAQIEQARAEALVDHLENQWTAQVNATRSAELVEYYRAGFMAQVARIQEQRAADMVEHYSNQQQPQLEAINEQRALDMVRFRFGEGR